VARLIAVAVLIAGAALLLAAGVQGLWLNYLAP
jgi:hypothetical protein